MCKECQFPPFIQRQEMDHLLFTTSNQTQKWQSKHRTYAMINLRNILQGNKYHSSITSVSSCSHRRDENNNRESASVCLLYIKATFKKIQRISAQYKIKIILKSSISGTNPQTEENMTKNCVYFIASSFTSNTRMKQLAS